MPNNTVFTQSGGGIDMVPMTTVTGKVTYDATAIVTTDYTRIATGFKPVYIKWINATDRTTIEWFAGMTASQNIKSVAAGTQTLDTTANAVVVDERGFSILQNATLGAIAASKECYFLVKG
jgi:hypothetical protein